MSEKKAPIVSGPLPLLIPVVDDSLAPSSIIMVLLDDGSAVGRLTLFNDSTIPVAITVALANADASSNRANANADIISQRRRGNRYHGCDYQKTLHKKLLFLCDREGNKASCQKFPEHDLDRRSRHAQSAGKTIFWREYC
jgi:hypothetical protein